MKLLLCLFHALYVLLFPDYVAVVTCYPQQTTQQQHNAEKMLEEDAVALKLIDPNKTGLACFLRECATFSTPTLALDLKWGKW